jgi:hypothetical protein
MMTYLKNLWRSWLWWRQRAALARWRRELNAALKKAHAQVRIDSISIENGMPVLHVAHAQVRIDRISIENGMPVLHVEEDE